MEQEEKDSQSALDFSAAIVNISSQASLIAIPDHTSYCVSKGGLKFFHFFS